MLSFVRFELGRKRDGEGKRSMVTFIPPPVAYAKIFAVFCLGDDAPFLQGLRDDVVCLASTFFD